MDRVIDAAEMVEMSFAVQKERAGTQSKDVLLTYVALGLADEVLQARKEQEKINDSIERLLSNIKAFS